MSLRDPAFKRKVYKEIDVLNGRCLRKAKRLKTPQARQRKLIKCIRSTIPAHSWEWVKYFKSKGKGKQWRRK